MSKFERIIPLLVYEDIPAAHDFLVAAFGFAAGGVERNAEGLAVHGEVRVGDTEIWLHRATESLTSRRQRPSMSGGTASSFTSTTSMPITSRPVPLEPISRASRW